MKHLSPRAEENLVPLLAHLRGHSSPNNAMFTRRNIPAGISATDMAELCNAGYFTAYHNRTAMWYSPTKKAVAEALNGRR